MKLITAFLLGVILTLTGCDAQTPERELKNTLAEMKVLIEQGKYRELATSYVHPDDLRDISQKELDEMEPANEGSRSKLQRFHRLLTRAESLVPSFTADNTRASFYDESFPRPLTFEKVEGRWRIKD